jgi:outer membrane protein OmpA-like peptidoglycan-associated protein
MTPKPQTLITVASTVLSMSLLTACLSSGASTTVATTARCSTAATPGKKTPTVAILGQAGPASIEHKADFATVIQGAEAIKARVLVNAVGSGTGAPSLLANAQLVGDGANDTERQANLTCKEKLVDDAFDNKLTNKLPKPAPLDAFSALNTLAGNLVGTADGAEVDVVLLSSLQNSAAPADLMRSEVLDNPVATLNTLASKRLLPNCKGWRGYVVGGSLGSTNSQDAQLREFWRQYFNRCGGALVAWTTHLDAFPLTNGAIQAADTSQIHIQRDPDKIVATLGGDVLFSPGSAELRASATSQLAQVLPLAGQANGRIVVTGYTDTGGNEADNVTLSQRRAAAVARWLIQNKVQAGRIKPGGTGSRHALFPNPKSPAEHQANRRVTITIYTS